MKSHKETFFGNSTPVDVVDNALSVTDESLRSVQYSAFGETLIAQLYPRAACKVPTLWPR